MNDNCKYYIIYINISEWVCKYYIIIVNISEWV